MASKDNQSLTNCKFEKNINGDILRINDNNLDSVVIEGVQNALNEEVSVKSNQNSTPEKHTETKNNKFDLSLKIDVKDGSSGSFIDCKETVTIYDHLTLKYDLCKNYNDFSDECKLEVSGSRTVIPEDLTNNNHGKVDIISDVMNSNSFLEDSNISVNCTDQHLSDNTPCKDKNIINSFKKGVTCTSTPLNHSNYQKQIKNKFANLSVIKEEDGGSDVSKDSEITLVPNEGVADKISPDLLRNDLKETCVQDILNSLTPESISDLTVLIKDEMSLLIDIPNETLLKDVKIDIDKNNLTVSLKNSEAIIYKNLVDKTINDIINGADLAAKELDIEIVKQEILKAGELNDFISTNEEENRDNNDPEWDYFKKLETDDERYKAVRKIWRNLGMPDLKQNLSAYNWRLKNSLSTNKNIKTINKTEVLKMKENCTFGCTEVFEVGKRNLHSFYHRQLQGLTQDSDNDTSIMASLNKKPRLENQHYQVKLINDQAKLGKLVCCVQERLIRHDEAIQEINAIHKFYNGLKNQGNGGFGNLMFISQAERQAILDTENMISKYISWYPEEF